MTVNNIALNMDCMEYLKSVPDKYFDLAVVDPPYGGGAKEEYGAKLNGGGQTLRADHAPASDKGLTATISACRSGGKWATRYQRTARGATSIKRATYAIGI